ncbi:hypothetical protein [Pantoea sp. RIT-PI-b]|uniref:hypothetical protein n=1 Tax=Pantoea sp. RIT-PI-b TaxID=1681195 RepID=UPI00092CFED8|nr:hypothetical protein [Pantoea sp. RIT-PI-b]
MYGLNKVIIVCLTSLIISGCTLNFRPSPEEYTGTDAARVRVGNDGNTAIRTYEKIGECYKKVSEKSVTSSLVLMGIPTTGNKKVAGMTPSADIKTMSVKEYSIKPNQYLEVVRYYTESHTYGSFERQISTRLYPLPNHDYDVIVSDISIRIKDLTPSEGGTNSWSGDLCKTGFFG